VSNYGTALPFRVGLKNFFYYFTNYLDPSMALWFLAAGGTVCIWKDREAGIARLFVPALLLLSMAAVSQGMYFRPHYFIMLLPGLALALGIGASSLRRLILKAESRVASPKLPAIYTVVALALVVFGLRKFFFVMTPDEVCRMLYYPGEAFVETVQIAEHIKEHTTAGDRIAVIGSEPQILFYSGRQSATGYIYTYTLMEPTPFAKQMQQDMIQQIEAARPEYLVMVTMPNSWDAVGKSEMLIFDWADKYCRDFYDLDGEVDFPPDKPPKFLWGKEAAGAPVASHCIYILKRKATAGK
jgi:hypothetical protein